jgi:hypothetical protein
MKHTQKILLGCLLIVGLQFAWTGCVVPVEGRGGYGGGPWFGEGVWLDGGGRGSYGHGGGAYVHPGGGGGRR